MADIDWQREQVAKHFLLRGIQHWGQTDEEREQATRKYVAAAGKEFGTREAEEWLKGVLSRLRRGKFETEVEQLIAALASAKEAV